ncbi:MAG: hypothetical protein M1814_005711 [Vezdaea aestivalis]|nr:MAG: hypothetical protein M1814_005711 [Vezdaea aestivalis]
MVLEEQRFLHEELERLEQGITDRVKDEPRNIRDRLIRDHQIAKFLSRIQTQSSNLLTIYTDASGARSSEIQTLSTGDPFAAFYNQLDTIKDFHKRYPSAPVENLERVYRKREDEGAEIDALFSGEEAFGRFLDLTTIHEAYMNLNGVMVKPTYMQYLDRFDKFSSTENPIKHQDRQTDKYFAYVGDLANYLEGFMRRTQPLEDIDKPLADIGAEFTKIWDANEIPFWASSAVKGPDAMETDDDLYCKDCDKHFTNANVYKSHLTGKKHIRSAQARASTNGNSSSRISAQRLKERAIAEREFRVQRLSTILDQQRKDTRANVERKAGMTERERALELEAIFADDGPGIGGGGGNDSDNDSDSSERIYNPLKLPLAWDGKPIPFWLYKLHGLGVEFPCEICGNFVYMGRRAFDKHFSEGRHLHGLRCLNITNTNLFREITGIQDALKLWDKLQRDEKARKAAAKEVQMEDREGNVMPEKVYYDLQKQGLL